MKKFCVIANSDKDDDFCISRMVCEKITKLGAECVFASRNYFDHEDQSHTDKSLISGEYDCAIVLGGDGTMIQASKDLLEYDIPILGVNLGTLGYITEVEIHGIDNALRRIMKDDYFVESRFMLKGQIISKEMKCFDDIVLNDIVISRSGFSRIISVNVYINGEYVNTYHGDGVIISTPTGSTGYNLSAGGPIVKPDSKLMVISPICPHSVNNRSIVVDYKDEIMMEVVESKKSLDHEAMATFDGRSGIGLRTGDRIITNRYDKYTKLIHFGEKGFFDILRDKL